MSLAEDNLQFVLLHAMADAVKKELGRLREGHTSTLVQVYKDTKGTAYKVSLPGSDDVVATVTLRVPKSELEFPDGMEEGSAFLKWAADNHPDIVELEHVPAEPERIIPAVPAHDVPFVNAKKLTELTKHFTRGDEGEVVDTSTGLVVDGARWSTPPEPNQFEVRYEPDGRDRIGTAYRAGKLNEVVGGTSLGAITAGPVVERRLVVAPDPAPSRAVCTDRCRDRDHEYVDQCDPVNCGHHHPGGPAVMTSVPVAPPEDAEPIVATSLEEAFGEDSGAPRYGYEVVEGVSACPYDDCPGCVLCDPDGDYADYAGDGDQEWRAESPADPADVDVDQLGPEYGDGKHPLPGEATVAAGAWGGFQPQAAGEPFDPGDWK